MVIETLIIGLLCIISFTIGARVGQKISKGEEITPIKSPIKVINEINESFETRREIEKNKIIAENIDNYNGTGLGQKDLPR